VAVADGGSFTPVLVALALGEGVAVGLALADGVAESVALALGVSEGVGLSAGTAVSASTGTAGPVGPAAGVGLADTVSLGVGESVAVVVAVWLPRGWPGKLVEVGEGLLALAEPGTVVDGVSLGVAVADDSTAAGVAVLDAVGDHEGVAEAVSVTEAVSLALGVTVGESTPRLVVPESPLVAVMAIVPLAEGTGVSVATKIGVTSPRAATRSAGPPPTPSGAPERPGAPPS